MTERTPLGYCIDCPMADWLNIHAEAYIADTPSGGIDDSSVEILQMPTNLSDEEIDDAARAFSMSDREAIRFGVDEAQIDKMKKELSECYTMLGNCALESNCQGKIVTEGQPQRCAAVGAREVYERMMKAFELNILGFEQ